MSRSMEVGVSVRVDGGVWRPGRGSWQDDLYGLAFLDMAGNESPRLRWRRHTQAQITNRTLRHPPNPSLDFELYRGIMIVRLKGARVHGWIVTVFYYLLGLCYLGLVE